MGGTSSRGRAFAAMNEEQPLTPTTPRKEITQPWSLPPDAATSSQSEDKPEDQTHSSVFDGESSLPHITISSFQIDQCQPTPSSFRSHQTFEGMQHTSGYLRYLRTKQTVTPLPTTPEKVTTLPCKMHNFFI